MIVIPVILDARGLGVERLLLWQKGGKKCQKVKESDCVSGVGG
jgi:hypothetical protein